MADARLVCRGFDLGGHHVPPFEVRRGNAVTLRMPSFADWDPSLTAYLTAKEARPQVELVGQCVRVRPARPPVGWRGWLSNPGPADWLIGAGFSPAEAAAVLSRHRISNRSRLSQCAGTPLALLGLEAAYRFAPDFILFDTAGLDPRGEQEVQDLVRSRLDRTAAVYLSGPVLCGGARSYRKFPGSAVVAIIA